jgi:hypothetical protein
MKSSKMATMLALFGLASCNFDDAFNRYCENNPRCHADAGPTSDAAPASDVAPTSDLRSTPDVAPTLEVGQGSEVNDAESRSTIPPPRNCSPPNGCSSTGEFCHPLSQICVKICNVSSDCPRWLDSCSDTRSGSPRGQKFCSCTATSCNSYIGFVCDSTDGLCKPICNTDQDCSGGQVPRTCDQMSGVCVPIPLTCSSNTDCTSQQPHCDPATLLCTRCVSAADCAGRTDGGALQCGSGGTCVGPMPGP